jgi:hypothetical protein
VDDADSTDVTGITLETECAAFVTQKIRSSLVTWHMEAQARLAKETPFFNTIGRKRPRVRPHLDQCRLSLELRVATPSSGELGRRRSTRERHECAHDSWRNLRPKTRARSDGYSLCLHPLDEG